jgi:hypothetical protein
MPRTSYTPVSLFSRLAMPLLFAVGLISACDKGNDQAERRYCDQSGCYACTGGSCYPVPGDPAKPDPGPTGSTTCDNDAACGDGKLCNVGRCEPACKDDSSCASGLSCVTGRCRPSGATQCGLSGGVCTADAQCGASAKCVNKTCASLCPDNKCALGQVCSAGACVEDPAPAATQCQFDLDCGGAGAFRCINAYCLPTCSDNKQCTSGATCVKGTCRGSRFPG